MVSTSAQRKVAASGPDRSRGDRSYLAFPRGRDLLSTSDGRPSTIFAAWTSTPRRERKGLGDHHFDAYGRQPDRLTGESVLVEIKESHGHQENGSRFHALRRG